MPYTIPYLPQQMHYTGNPATGTQIYTLLSESLFNSYPSILLSSGFDCQGAHDYILANLASIINSVVPDGYALAAVACADLINPYPATIGWKVETDLIAYGVNYKDDDECAINDTAPWPMVFGPGGNVGSVTFRFNQQNAGPGMPDVGISRIVNRVDVANFNYELWWCAHSGCCAPVETFYGGRFLIPPPASPLPGEEGVTTPLLFTPIYLSNHTFQFVANYGRINK